MADLLDSIFKLSRVEQITLVQLILDNVAVSEEEDTNSWLTVEVKEELERRSMAIKDGTTQNMTKWRRAVAWVEHTT